MEESNGNKITHPIKKHGIPTSYTYGCRCEDCKKAHADYNYETNKKYVKPKEKSDIAILEESIKSEPIIKFYGKTRR